MTHFYPQSERPYMHCALYNYLRATSFAGSAATTVAAIWNIPRTKVCEGVQHDQTNLFHFFIFGLAHDQPVDRPRRPGRLAHSLRRSRQHDELTRGHLQRRRRHF